MFGYQTESAQTAKRYHWCWRCRGIVRGYRSFVDRNPRCEHCHQPTTAMSPHRLRMFAFLREQGPTEDIEELLRRARVPPRQRDHRHQQHGSHDSHNESRQRRRQRHWHEYDQRRQDSHRRQRGTPHASRRMSRAEALAVLGLAADAAAPQIRAAYRRLARQYHPDKHRCPHAKQQAHAWMTRINRAYACLRGRPS